MKQLNKYILEKLVLTNKTKIRNNKFQSVLEKIKNILKKGKDKDAIDNLYKELNETVGDMFHNSGSFKLEWWKPWNGNIFFGNRAKNTMCLVLTLMNNREFCFTFFDDFSEEYYVGIKSSKEEHLKSFNIDMEDFKQFKTEFIDTFNLTPNKTSDNAYVCNYKDIVTEKLVLNSNSKIRKRQEYNYHPKTSKELKELIKQLIKERGNEADLNDIDTSEITDMYHMFASSEFNGDISKWNVSNVEDMYEMFFKSKFNGDISKWNVSKVWTMESMFEDTEFNNDISGWDVSNVENMCDMFRDSKFNSDISKWNVSKVEDMDHMFQNSEFNWDISKWDVSKVKYMSRIFNDCPIKEEYKPKFK